MSRPTLKRIVLLLTGGIVAIIGIGVLWGYILSFQDVTFRYDTKIGYIELIDKDNNKLYPKNNQPIQMIEGEYHIQNVGERIEPEYRKLTITNDTATIDTPFSYTEDYLDTLLKKEQADAQAVLYEAYPSAKNTYRLRHEKLYERGNIYGAILVARTPGDNSDTLRVVMKKQKGKWTLLSTPPSPFLGAPDYPDIDIDTLADINRAK